MLVYKKKAIKKDIALAQKVPKTPKQLERHFKGIASYRRIEILSTIAENKMITLDGICYAVKGNVKTISEHTKKLLHAGLIRKYRNGRVVVHSLSPYGKVIHEFLKSFAKQ